MMYNGGNIRSGSRFIGRRFLKCEEEEERLSSTLENRRVPEVSGAGGYVYRMGRLKGAGPGSEKRTRWDRRGEQREEAGK